MKLWRKTTRRSLVSAQKSAAPIVFARPSPMAPPISAPSRSVTSAARSRVSTHDDEHAERRTHERVQDPSGLKGRVRMRRVGDRQNKKDASENEPRHQTLRV